MWYVPFDGPAQFVRTKPHSFEEHLAISPTLFVLYNIDKGSPNPTLQKFGHVLSNIPGDAIFISEGLSSHYPEDISENIEQELPAILEKDSIQRSLFFRWARDSGMQVVSL
jgi:hypothetical protein